MKIKNNCNKVNENLKKFLSNYRKIINYLKPNSLSCGSNHEVKRLPYFDGTH